MKLIDLQYYINLHHNNIECKVYFNHENWLEILKEIGYIEKIYEKCDYYYINKHIKAYSTINSFNYRIDFISVHVGNSMYSYPKILTENERIIKDIIE